MEGLSVENNPFYPLKKTGLDNLWLLPCMALALVAGWMVSRSGLALPALFIGLPLALAFFIAVFLKPRFGFWIFLVYCFVMPGLGKHFPGQLGLLYDGILLITWLSVLFWQNNRYRWRHCNNQLVWLSVGWFVLSVLEMANPARPDPQGWIQEARGVTLYWIMMTPLAFLLLNKRSDVGFFINLIIIFSFLGALYGMKQMYAGPDAAERAWLDAGAKTTHIVAGKLRVFSFFAEAAQFGASQGQLAIMCLILAMGPYARSKKIWYGIAAAVIFYGMLISGTRGAMGALAGGGLVFLILSKKVRILILGSLIGLLFIGGLKYTLILNNNYQVRRLRSSMDSNDASLQVRLANQRLLADYLKSRPFGTGVGTSGTWGSVFNRHIPIATVPPDSLYVKIWVMYGVVGVTIWLGIMFFILGTCCGIVWKTRDPVLQNQLIALTAVSFGALVCSYGNEVMNQMPTMAIVYVCWVLVFASPRWDTPEEKKPNAPAKKTELEFA